MPGPAPPLPPGPPPPQPPYPQQDAHAAAWAAYYASQGQTGGAGATYTPPTQGSAQAAGGAANPYANYGYSAHASAQHSAFIQSGQQTAQPYRPPNPQQPQATVNAPYTAPAYGYQAPQAYGQQYPLQAAAGQPAYNWTASQPQQPYRPPAQTGYNSPGQAYIPPNQPYTPSPMRPSATPTPGPNRPYQPQPRVPSGPGRPPMAGPGTPPQFPPAKRPRFDGPGNQNPPMAPSGPMNNANMQNRPPHMHAVRPAGPNIGQQPYVPRPPLPASLPAAPRGPAGGVPLGPSNTGSNASSAAPIVRPPIHLGLNGPPPPLPFGGSMRGRSVRGGLHGSGGHGAAGGMGRSGPVNAPRGPAGMRRPEPARQSRENDRKRRDKEREKTKERDEKITMTDFRIVGIEVKALGWSWGLTGEAAAALEGQAETEQIEEGKEGAGAVKEDEGEPLKEDKDESDDLSEPVYKEEKAAENEADGAVEAEVVAVAAVKGEVDSDHEAAHDGTEESRVVEESAEGAVTTEVKAEAAESVEPAENADSSESVEEKRGEKRKAKTPDGEEEGSSPKKRPGEYLLTHRKPNDAVEPTTTPSASTVHESNQNRFRIYFESPPELDRVPKALRRNPNKRWRRASSSVAPSVVPEGRAAREGTVGTIATLEDVGEEAGAATERIDEQTAGQVEMAAKAEEREEATEVEEIVDAQAGTAAAEVAAPDVATEAVATEAVVADDTVLDLPSSEVIETPKDDLPAVELQVKAEADAEEHVGDVSMRSDSGVAAAISELVDSAAQATPQTVASAETTPSEATVPAAETPKPETSKFKLQGIHSLPPKPQTATSAAPPMPKSAALETIAEGSTSAENAASAYRSRTRRRSSVSSQGSIDETLPDLDVPTPSFNRVSILYEGSQRRLCIDAAVVETVRIYRAAGKIEMVLTKLDKGEEGKELPKGVLAEMYDTTDQRFANATLEKLEEIWTEPYPTLPPLHRPLPDEPMVLTVYLNKKRPLSEPKWCRTDGADEWLGEQFGPRRAEGGWRGKLRIVDPDPPPTLQSILDSWAGASNVGIASDRRTFTRTLQSDPNDLLEILLRLTRGDRNATTTATLGPLATAIRADSPFASHQTHVSLAILAMYRLTTDYAAKAGEKSEVVNEKICDIIKSLPGGMIHRSLDGLFKEWKGK